MAILSVCVYIIYVRHTQVTEKKLSKLDMAYQSYLEQQARLEDPVRRLEVRLAGVRDS